MGGVASQWPPILISIMSLVSSIPYIQIVLSLLLIGGILLQQSEAGLGGAFGGGDGFSSGHHTKRGAERTIFIATIIIAILFVVTSFSLLFLTQ
ncbi:MAG: Preprotein translocase, SecG subunit [Parcubacteria group bacterium GW2011_GWB1_40_5]|nr:MAG: Preprotein translocase, SecG subunit [Parcubacteria group bacterium GW2011_GWB1_40_5]